MEKFYRWVTLGLLLTTVTAWGTAFHLFDILFAHLSRLDSSMSGISFFLIWVVLLSIGAIMAFFLWWKKRIWSFSARSVYLLLIFYSVLAGLVISITMFYNTQTAIVQVYLPPLAMFFFMAIYAKITGRDSILTMGLFGLALAVFLKFYLGVSWVGLAVSTAVIFLFMLLAAWSRNTVRQHMSEDMELNRATLGGALEFYLVLSLCFVFWLIFFIRSQKEE